MKGEKEQVGYEFDLRRFGVFLKREWKKHEAQNDVILFFIIIF